MIHFTFRYLHDRFDICLQSKYTILIGDSGTGKSFLSEMAEQFVNEPRYGSCSGNFSIDSMTKERWKSALKSSANVVVVDEDVLLDDDADDKVLSLLRTTDKYFIVIGRDGVGGIPFGMHSIFESEIISGNHRRMVPAEEQRMLMREAVSPARLLICEDSKSGYIAAKHVYKNSDCKVVSVGGNSNFKSMEYTSGYIVADLCGLGESTFALVELVEDNPGLQVCNVISFEAEALRSQGVAVTEGIEDPSVDNAEKYYEHMLQERTFPKYSKTSTHSVISLFTGFNAHSKERLQGFKPSDGWWVPGVDVQSEGETQFLTFYRAVYGRDFDGEVPDDVRKMQAIEVYDNFIEILRNLGI